MFKRINPNIIKLWVIYQENNITITGATDLTVEIQYADGTVIVSDTALVENPSGFYSYMWNTSNVNLDELILVFFKKDSNIMSVDEFIVDVLEDMDAVAM